MSMVLTTFDFPDFHDFLLVRAALLKLIAQRAFRYIFQDLSTFQAWVANGSKQRILTC